MKILTGAQIREADIYTINHEPVASIDLMERAARKLSSWIMANYTVDVPFYFYIGKGNNGGDGLAVARILSEYGYSSSICCIFDKDELSEDNLTNLKRMPKGGIKRFSYNLQIPENGVIVDALLGSGVKDSVNGILVEVFEKINSLPNSVISIDLPSGLKTEWGNIEQKVIKADITLTIEFPKLAMLLPEAGEVCGQIVIMPIDLNADYIRQANSHYYFTDKTIIKQITKDRSKFAYKNLYGHSLLICGSLQMGGAALLATEAALRSGCGLVTIHVPSQLVNPILANSPSALLSIDDAHCFTTLPNNINKYTSIGVGCGLGQSDETITAFKILLESFDRPLVIDADALNILAENKHFLQFIPKDSILTPHLGELKRLVGKWQNEENKIQLSSNLAKELQSTIVVKGAYSMICFPDGNIYFNSTGNNGMAKGGSGDVLTGLLSGLLARGYNGKEAAILGVYLHGLAGDIAEKELGAESMHSKDIVHYLPQAFKLVSSYS